MPVPATDKAGNAVTDAQGNAAYQKNPDGTYVCNPNTVPERAIAYRQLNGLAPDAPVPVDAVTASGSGLDPDISVANALDQAARVAQARHLNQAQIVDLVHRHTHGRAWGILGEKTVNVLDLNLALDQLGSRIGATRWPGHAAGVPGRRPRRRQDLRHAQRGPPAPRRGTDVVVGMVETHGRALTEAQIGDLEIIPRARVGYRGAEFEEMDVDAVIARRPDLALVDELAHTNVPGLQEREALAGRRGDPRRRHRRHLHRQHPAPRIAQ